MQPVVAVRDLVAVAEAEVPDRGVRRIAAKVRPELESEVWSVLRRLHCRDRERFVHNTH